MNGVICVLYDGVANNYSAPMTFANDAAAKRYLAVSKDPVKTDYTMFKIAEYNSFTGELKPIDARVVLCRGTDYVKTQEEED